MFDTGTKILIVDDMMMMRTMMKKNLQKLGFQDITDAKNGQEAWEKLESSSTDGKTFDLILSDWNMPELTGIEFLQKIRTDNRFNGIPFVMVTAENEKEQVMKAMQSGVSHYVVKPFTAETLKEKLEAVYNKVKAAS